MKDKVIYYPRPFQVLFLRPDLKEPTYEQGIVYRYDIIAARDGETFTTRDVLECARWYNVDEDYAIVEGFEWVPLEIN